LKEAVIGKEGICELNGFQGSELTSRKEHLQITDLKEVILSRPEGRNI
jgi:hypothetical protein